MHSCTHSESERRPLLRGDGAKTPLMTPLTQVTRHVNASYTNQRGPPARMFRGRADGEAASVQEQGAARAYSWQGA